MTDTTPELRYRFLVVNFLDNSQVRYELRSPMTYGDLYHILWRHQIPFLVLETVEGRMAFIQIAQIKEAGLRND